LLQAYDVPIVSIIKLRSRLWRDVQVTERSDRGDGIARIQGFVIFVKNGKVGDNVKVKVTSVGNRFAIAEVL
jgi:predicted RNA-binding protein with TRAM domain